MSDSATKKSKRKWPKDVHWYADQEGLELMEREMFDLGIKEVTEYHRRKLFGRNKKARLEALRAKHKAAGLTDQQVLRTEF